jgi:hypothetical protein
MELVDLNKPETWRNSSPPRVDQTFDRELLAIAGTNRYGQPNLRRAWGQARRQHACGDPAALLYIDNRLPPVVRKRHSLRRTLFVERAEVVTGIDVKTGEPVVEARQVPHYETRYLEEEPQVIPSGWVYACEEVLEWVGEQLWYIEQWRPSEMIAGGEWAWNRDRFAPGVSLRTGKFQADLDWMGPFPRYGEYVSIMVVGEPYLYPYVDEQPVYYLDPNDPEAEPVLVGTRKEKMVGRHMRYRELGRDVLDALREGAWKRQFRTRQSAEQKQRERLYTWRQRVRQVAAANRAYARAAMRERQHTFTSTDKGGIRGGNSRSLPTPGPMRAKGWPSSPEVGTKKIILAER